MKNNNKKRYTTDSISREVNKLQTKALGYYNKVKHKYDKLEVINKKDDLSLLIKSYKNDISPIYENFDSMLEGLKNPFIIDQKKYSKEKEEEDLIFYGETLIDLYKNFIENSKKTLNGEEIWVDIY